MAIDGLFLYNIAQQLNQVCPCKINKIQNISDEELLMVLHTKQGNKKLVINVRSNTNRLYFVDAIETTQNTPSSFVMVLRKQLGQATIESIEQIEFDRLIKFNLQTRNEFGDAISFCLYIELMGKYANVVLVNQDNTIVDALKRIPVYENSKRTIHPGATYTLPSQPEKQNPLEVRSIDTDTSLVSQVYGFSPLLSKEFLYRMHNGHSFQEILKELLTSHTLYIKGKEYHCISLTHINQEEKSYPLMEGLQKLYQDNETKVRIKEQCGDVFRTVLKEKKKAEKKLPKLQDSLKQAQGLEMYKEYGDLLFAYMSQIKKDKEVQLPRFEDGNLITIPIDMRFDIKGNANKYYQKYHKLKRGQTILEEQIQLCKKDIDYFSQLEEQLNHCSIEDALEIRQELIDKRILTERKSRAKKKKKAMPNLLHLQVENADIYVGKNNIQNHYIISKLARKQDTWFHVKDYHGSHVLCKAENMNETLIRMCAMLASFYSKGAQSSSVPVDYCTVSQLRKVPGATLGFVTMKQYQTIFIDPEQKIIQEWMDLYKVK